MLTETYISYIKEALHHSIFVGIERSFRLFVLALENTESRGPNGQRYKHHTQFSGIHSQLLDTTSLNKWIPAIRIATLSRNSLHNNGVFLPPDNKNDIVRNYRGADYEFIVGQPIEFISWDLLLLLIEDLIIMTIDVVNSSSVTSLPFIHDPLSEV